MPQASSRFNGERLQVAREFRGLTQKQLAEETVTSYVSISNYETAKRYDPPVDLIEAFGTVLGFNPEFFYGPIEDPFLQAECNFRHRRTTPERLKTRVRAHATLFGMVMQKLRQFLAFPELNLPRFPVQTIEDAEVAAEQARLHWGLGLDAPLLQITRVLERAGVIVVPHIAESDKIDAFSRNGKTAVVFLNKSIPSTSRWNFDLAHECAHLVIHDGIPTGDELTEQQADRFASAFLMPSRAFSREFQARPFSWSHVFNLKRRWRTSAGAIVRRARDLGLINAVRYRQAFQYMSLKKWRSEGEPMEPDFHDPELLALAVESLKSGAAGSTLTQLSQDLNFTLETFRDVTGVDIEASAERSNLLSFSRNVG